MKKLILGIAVAVLLLAPAKSDASAVSDLIALLGGTSTPITNRPQPQTPITNTKTPITNEKTPITNERVVHHPIVIAP